MFKLCPLFTVVYDAPVITLYILLNIPVKASLEETPKNGVLAPRIFSLIAQFLFKDMRLIHNSTRDV